MPVEGRGLGSRQTQQAVRDREIGQPNNSETCSEAADGVTRESEGRSRLSLLCPEGGRSGHATISDRKRYLLQLLIDPYFGRQFTVMRRPLSTAIDRGALSLSSWPYAWSAPSRIRAAPGTAAKTRLANHNVGVGLQRTPAWPSGRQDEKPRIGRPHSAAPCCRWGVTPTGTHRFPWRTSGACRRGGIP